MVLTAIHDGGHVLKLGCVESQWPMQRFNSMVEHVQTVENRIIHYISHVFM